MPATCINHQTIHDPALHFRVVLHNFLCDGGAIAFIFVFLDKNGRREREVRVRWGNLDKEWPAFFRLTNLPPTLISCGPNLPIGLEP
jgi:hypothetical protein